MNKVLKTFLLASAFVGGASASNAATQITVEDIGSILNQSLALPAEDTPGSGIGFEEYFEFTIPTRELVTVSMSDSATGSGRISGGTLGLNFWTSSAPVSPFQPIGALIESSPIANVIGGQEATVTPDALNSGAYFAEISGVSGGAPIHIAVDGTITALATPEPSTWAMMGLGFGLIAFMGFKRRRTSLSLFA